jgi:hypothetical protein
MAADDSLDDGIANLERFCALLAETHAGLEQATAALAEQRAGLDEVEQDLATRTDALQAALEGALQEVEEALRGAREEADGLTQAAEEAADVRLAGLAEGVDRLAAEAQERLVADRSLLEREMQSLADGFTSCVGTLEGAGSTLTAAGDEGERALADLRQAATELAERSASAGEESLATLAAAQQELAAAQQSFEQSSGEVASGWQGLAGAVEEQCSTVAGALQSLYDGWRDELAAAGAELVTEVGELAQQAAAAVLDESQGLAQAVDDATQGSLAALGAELERLAAPLADGEQAADEASGLVDDLVVAREVVAEVDELLDALQEAGA